MGCTELAAPLDAVVLGRAGPAPCLGSEIELILLTGHRGAGLENVSLGGVAPLLIYHMVAQVRERCPLSPFALLPSLPDAGKKVGSRVKGAVSLTD